MFIMHTDWKLRGCTIWVFPKDAGIEHESFQNKMNGVIWDFCFSEMNPQNESFDHFRTKQIPKTNFLNTVGWNESTKRIF
jgi:hypothetical protein